MAAPIRTMRITTMAQGCLALNASYEPLTVMPLKRAVRLVIQGKAEVLEADDTRTVRSAQTEIPRPAVIRLVRFVKVPQKFKRSVTNTFLFARDRYTCQYCGRHDSDLGRNEGLTRDHIHPQSKGGGNTWENVVTACSRCNHKKGDRSLEDSGLALLTAPTVPDMVWLKWSVRKLTPLQARYVEYFYGAAAVRGIRGE